ncbi:hypothetical protein Tco_1531911 [Tanacetum coccineum]
MGRGGIPGNQKPSMPRYTLLQTRAIFREIGNLYSVFRWQPVLIFREKRRNTKSVRQILRSRVQPLHFPLALE